MKKKQTTTEGFAILSVSGIINKILALVYVPIQTHIVGNYGNGIIGTGSKIYIFIFFLTNAGIPTVLSKLISEEITIGNYKNAQRIFKISASVLLTLGLMSSLFMFLGAHWITQQVAQPKAYLMILALSPALIFTAASSALRGYFQGWSNMIPTALSQILEQSFNSIFTVVFVALLIKYGYEAAAAGSAIGTLIGALSAFIFLLIIYIANRRKLPLENSKDSYLLSKKDIFKKLVVFCLPGILSITIANTYELVDLKIGISRLIASGIDIYKATELYGVFTNQYQRILNIPLSLTAALPTALIPAISMALALKDNQMVSRKISESFKAIFIILIPSAMGLVALSKPVITFIFFSTKLNQGSDLLIIGAWTVILIAVINVESAILIGFGKPYIAPIYMVIGLIVKILCNYLFISIPAINIKGAIIGTILSYMLVCILNYIVIMKSVKISFDIRKLLFKPVFASLIMASTVYAVNFLSNKILSKIISNLLINNAISTVFSIIIGAVLYSLLLIKLKVINSSDILKLPFGKKINQSLIRLSIIK